MYFSFKRLGIIAVALGILLLASLPAFAQRQGPPYVSIQDCQIVVSFYMPASITTSGAPSPDSASKMAAKLAAGNTVLVELWDDGTLLQTIEVTDDVEAYVTVYFPIDRLYGGEDVGIYVMDTTDTYEYFSYDPFEILDSVASPCLASADCPYPPTPLLGQGRVLGPVTTYFAPSLDKATNPPVVLPVGTSWWILEARDGFYKLFIACQGQYVWVTADSLGANFDVVWNGAPLPDAGTQADH